jgi:hypothetical protein
MKKLTQNGFEHVALIAAVVVIFAISGVGLLVASHAASTGGVAPGQGQSSAVAYKRMARELIESGRLDDRDGRYMKQIRTVARGNFTCNVNPYIIKMLYGVVVKDRHRVVITSLNRKCTHVIAGAGEKSYHYKKGGGHAIDVGEFDGHKVTGGNHATLRYLNAAVKYLPKHAGFGQKNCHSGFNPPAGDKYFSDRCDHQHIQVPVRQLK